MTTAQRHPLDIAGALLLHLALVNARATGPRAQVKIDDVSYRALLGGARRQLELCGPAIEPHKYIAVKTALEALEAVERGQDTLGAIDIFRGHVEAIHGGPRDVDVGGKKISRKPCVRQAYLRAAAVALWKKLPDKRSDLLIEARRHIGIRTDSQYRKIVENFDQRHDFDIGKTRSPLSIHMPIVEDLINSHNYQRLSDFV